MLGENFPLKMDGKDRLMGFYTTRFVEAESAQEAEKVALEILRTEEPLISVEADIGKAAGAMIFFEEVIEVDKIGLSDKGFTFFGMEDGSANKSESECKT